MLEAMALMGSLRRVASGRPAATAAAAGSSGRRAGSCGGSTALFAAVAALGSVLLLLGGAMNTPGALGQAYLPATMIDGMEAAMFLNKFMDAADVTGFYDKFLDRDFSGTVFAPVDLGFEALMQKSNATWDDLTSPELNSTLATIVGMHVIPGQRLFPLSQLRDGLALDTAATGADGKPLKVYVRRDVPGIVHVYAVPRPEDDPLNFATVLQYQEIRGGKAILYVVDKVLSPPAKDAKAAGAEDAAAAPTFVRRGKRGGGGAASDAQRKA
ncbi:hypothetical protein HYH02_012724 [Chlamydomonas schloesseri]|uniref:FAS1 domain-containing protein n=1 Tax=Chlamydomonas schloesseri TaxID=2026947 RepID=A0A835VXQ3_9CHLO|nr:hypothetical protein HYH02_012724 [Chlamydomonas schloesseri]|eukprot:KAG2433182.1 hypothetical protein HYH02_012724 [Chlamydomonas schloesseri]